MTRAGQHLALVALSCVVASLVMQSRSLLATALILVWILSLDGLVLALACRGLPRLKLERLFEGRQQSCTVYCGKAVSVSLRMVNPTSYILSGEAVDLVPQNLALEGESSWRFTILPLGTTEITYRVRAERLCRVEFPGTAIRLFSPGGLWEVERFLPRKSYLQAVPDIFGKHFLPTLRKEKNVLLRHGRHLQRKGGTGAELLSLREYQEGDPPKRIAWRASAKREVLLSKEFENEVPFRTRIIFQPAPRFFLKEGSLLDEAGSLCARLARVLAEHRDLVEVVVPLPKKLIRTGEGLTRRHLLSVLRALGQAVAEPQVLPGPLTARELVSVHQLALFFEPGLKKAASRLLGRRFRLSTMTIDQGFIKLLLALFLSQRFDLGPGGIELLRRNPDVLGYFARKFASPLGVLAPLPKNGAVWWAATQSRIWAEALLSCLKRLALQARDSELFVLMADLGFFPKEKGQELLGLLSYLACMGHKVMVLLPEFSEEESFLRDFKGRIFVEESHIKKEISSRGIPVSSFKGEEGLLLALNLLRKLRRNFSFGIHSYGSVK